MILPPQKLLVDSTKADESNEEKGDEQGHPTARIRDCSTT